jgi:hypothetical protein
MQKKPWKLISHVPGLDKKPGRKEYYVVRETDQSSAIWRCLMPARAFKDC